MHLDHRDGTLDTAVHLYPPRIPHPSSQRSSIAAANLLETETHIENYKKVIHFLMRNLFLN